MRTKDTDKRGYPLAPTDVGKTAWFYEEAKGLHVIAQVNAATCGATKALIPWKKVEAAVDRHRRIKSAAKARGR
jgi:hypothetical protein